MKKAFTIAVALVGALMITGTANAQDVHYWPAPGANAGMKFFDMGTPVILKTRTQISTRDNKPGDRIYLEVAEALTYQGQVVLPIGAQAVAEVVRADRNGHFGRKGKVGVRLLYVDAPGGRVRLNGDSHKEGKSGAVLSIGTILLVSPLGFLIHGTSATIPDGTGSSPRRRKPR
jgi:hypothetical protein